jgi:hypothetical protein
MGNEEHQASQWQKIVQPQQDALEKESGRAGSIRKYLDLADLLIQRVQQEIERHALREKQYSRVVA